MSQPTRKFFTTLIALAALGIRQGVGTINSFIQDLHPNLRVRAGRHWNRTYGRDPQPFDALRPSAKSAIQGGAVRGKPFGPDRCRRQPGETNEQHLARIFPPKPVRSFGLHATFPEPAL